MPTSPKIQINLLFQFEAIVQTRPELVRKDYITSLRLKPTTIFL